MSNVVPQGDILYAATGDGAAILPHLLGRDVGRGVPLFVVGIALHEQQLCDIEGEVAAGILRNTYGEDFNPYVNKKMTGEHAKALGYVILRSELPLLDDWHLSDEGWQEKVVAAAVAIGPELGRRNRVTVHTYALRGDQASREVGGLLQFEYPLREPRTIEVAENIHRLHQSEDWTNNHLLQLF
jgi:hypothetical protein